MTYLSQGITLKGHTCSHTPHTARNHPQPNSPTIVHPHMRHKRLSTNNSRHHPQGSAPSQPTH